MDPRAADSGVGYTMRDAHSVVPWASSTSDRPGQAEAPPWRLRPHSHPPGVRRQPLVRLPADAHSASA